MKARLLVLWTVAVIATAISFIAHLTVRFETVRLGYDVGAARREQQRLVEARRLLSIEAATLSEPDRVEAVARSAFDMDVPDPRRIVSMQAGQPRRALAGRAR